MLYDLVEFYRLTKQRTFGILYSIISIKNFIFPFESFPKTLNFS